jgi:hypothetical protein
MLEDNILKRKREEEKNLLQNEQKLITKHAKIVILNLRKDQFVDMFDEW